MHYLNIVFGIIIILCAIVFPIQNNNKKIIRAYSFAAIKHNGQIRKNINNSPYINHPIEVTQLLSYAGVKDVDVLIAGVLHDVIEDTDATEIEIKTLFGKTVLNIIIECSHNNTLSKIEQRRYQLSHIKHISYGAKLIKMADGYSNLLELCTYPPINWSKERIDGYKIFLYARYYESAGINKYFDKIYTGLFNQYNISVKSQQDLDQRLEKYYKSFK